MWDVLQGIIAIFLVVLILALKESENKWITYVGWGIFILAKIMN